MVDRAAQYARRQQLVERASKISNHIDLSMTAICLFVFIPICSALLSFVIIFISAIVLTLLFSWGGQTLAFPPMPTFIFSYILLCYLLVRLINSERQTAIDKAHAEANRLDIAEQQAEQQAEQDAKDRAAYQAQLARQQAAQQAIDAANHQQWLAESARQQAAEERASRLAELERSVLRGWADFQVRADFLDTTDQGALLRGYAKELIAGLPSADWHLLHSTQNPTVRAIVGARLVL
jgi:hypothetical protein